MDKYDFIRNIKTVLDEFSDKELLDRKEEISTLLRQIVELECEYAKAGVR